MTQHLWSVRDLAEATHGEISGDWAGITGLSIDTRSLAKGELFIALQGDARDGHAFVSAALEAGAGAALVTHVPEGVAPDAPLLIVADTFVALQAIGHAARARCKAKVIGVTGSVGKTSTKDMLRQILAAQGHVHAAIRSFNNHWGVPLTLGNMDPEAEFAVIEMGMNHPGEITPLSLMAKPHVAVITTVEAVHLEAFSSVDGIADAKAEIFAGLVPGGTAVLNADNSYFDRLRQAAGAAKIVTFGRDAQDFRLLDVTIHDSVTTVRAEARGHKHSFRVGAPGAHLAMNALAALASASEVGADIARAGLSLAQWSPPEGRGVRWVIELGPGGLDGEITLIDESFNANPASVGAALEVLALSNPADDVGRIARGRRIAFLGDMLELGPSEMGLHAGLAALAAVSKIDIVHCCGHRMRALWEALPRERRGQWQETSEKLAENTRRLVDAGDICMVKGSKGARMGPIVEAIKSLGAARTGAGDAQPAVDER